MIMPIDLKHMLRRMTDDDKKVNVFLAVIGPDA